MTGSILWFDDDRILRDPPRFLISNVWPDSRPNSLLSWRFNLDGYKVRSESPLAKWYYILEERFFKQPASEWMRSRLGLADFVGTVNSPAGQRRYQALLASRSDADVLAELENKAVAMAMKFDALGTKVIYLFMPSTNFRDYADLYQCNLQRLGIPVIDFPRAPDLPNGYPDNYWQAADSHWTEKAVREIADKILAEVRRFDASVTDNRSSPTKGMR